MAVRPSTAKQSILRELYEANRDNGGKVQRHRTPARRVGLGSLAVVLLLLVGVMAASLRSPGESGERGQTRSLSAPVPMVPYARAGRGPVIGVGPADYKRLVQQPLIPLAGVFGLGIQTIVIDPGHGGWDPGAIAPNGLMEKTVTLAVSRRLAALLRQHTRYRILLTRETDTGLTLNDRVEFANRNNADLFISIHVNSLPQPPATVIETYYFGPPTGPGTLKLAAHENANSEYTMADFNAMIQRIGMTFKKQESRRLAHAIQRTLFTKVNAFNAEVTSAGVKTAPFVVLLGTNMPSVLVELTTLSNPAEAKRLATERYRNRLARYLEQGILNYLQSRKPTLMMASAN